MRRRRYLTAIGSAVGGGVLLTGTGASVDVWANRDAVIDVADDDGGFVGLSAGEENGEFVTDDGGQIAVDFGEDAFNPGARSTVDDVFRIRNNATEDRVIWIKDAAEGPPLGDRASINFFRGPVKVTNDGRFRIGSAIDAVPGTAPTRQRLSITGLVPPFAPGPADESAPPLPVDLSADRARKLWIEAGGVVVGPGGPAFDPNADVPYSGGESGENGGRLLLGSGEEMKVGVEVDNPKPDTGIDEIQIVARTVEDAKKLATTDTEFANGGD
jgi:hypothetical protein